MEIPFDVTQLVLWASALSALALIVTVFAVPWVVSRLPADYFNQAHRHRWRESDDEPVFAVALGMLKNVLGAVLVVLGVVMLFTPGQGLVTVLVGFLLMNFPGKFQLERWLVMRPGVMRAMNWLRKRHGEGPFEEPVALISSGD